jgi:N-acetylglucosaminyl-diphospho-decaprenol L-rhamnosyltransferase
MTSDEPILSVVVVSWNTADLLEACLRSCLTQQGLDPEIVVVDNASDDDSVARARGFAPAVRVLANRHNPGFASANNQGIRECRGRYVALLNPDTVVPPGTFAALAGFLDARPRAGACGPRLTNPDGTPQAFSHGDDPTPGYLLRRAANRVLHRRPMHDWGPGEPRRVDWVAGTCLVVRRAALEQVGLLDEKFFMYFEDNDWCLRFRRHGWEVWFDPSVEIVHLGGQSFRRNPKVVGVYDRSLRYFYRKHYGPAHRLWLRLALPLFRRFPG